MQRTFLMEVNGNDTNINTTIIAKPVRCVWVWHESGSCEGRQRGHAPGRVADIQRRPLDVMNIHSSPT